jgi:hypothetical protein
LRLAGVPVRQNNDAGIEAVQLDKRLAGITDFYCIELADRLDDRAAAFGHEHIIEKIELVAQDLNSVPREISAVKVQVSRTNVKYDPYVIFV